MTKGRKSASKQRSFRAGTDAWGRWNSCEK